MATAITCISVPPTLNPLIPLTPTTKLLRTPKPFFRPISITQFTNPPLLSSTTTSATTSAVGDGLQSSEEPISIDNLRGFIQLNLGKWNGSFNQFDCYGNLIQQISTKLSASSYGEDELLSLSQSLYIKQPPLYNAKEEDEQEWYEYKIKETNMFTVDKYQQIGFFPKEKAFALRYQMAGMLETVLRQGVLGEDDTGEESPKNLKLPSRRPALVCENCLYSLEKDMRVRAFHVMDPQGTLEMLYIFLEERDSTKLDHKFEGDEDRITPHLGTWKGHSITKRSGVYGATISQANTTSILEIDKNGKLIQDVSTTIEGKDVTTNVHWTGTTTKNLITFDKGYQMTLLPLGIYMGCPCDLTKSVQESKSFHLELCWLESRNKRQRLVRTFDLEGLAVSSTYFFETKI